MFIGNVMLLVLNLPLVGIWARLTMVPYKLMAPIILLLCVVGAYSVRNSIFDVWVSLGFGVLGYFMRKGGWPAVPLILCYILGPMLEGSLIESLLAFQGNIFGFFKRPLAACLILIAFASIVLIAISKRRLKYDESFVE
jgi:putative tricarboxylic transport membrane protein